MYIIGKKAFFLSKKKDAQNYTYLPTPDLKNQYRINITIWALPWSRSSFVWPWPWPSSWSWPMSSTPSWPWTSTRAWPSLTSPATAMWPWLSSASWPWFLTFSWRWSWFRLYFRGFLLPTKYFQHPLPVTYFFKKS